jgi:uncharacterized protein (TIGR03435 family)
MSFDSASIKPNFSGPQAGITSNFVLGPGDRKPPNGVLTATNIPLAAYISFAYKLDQNGAGPIVSQLPKWTRTEWFDIEARPPGTNFTRDQVRLMMQSLLAERFKLAVHFETKDGLAYALVLTKAGKLGSQLRAFPDGFTCSDVPPAGAGRGGGPAPIVATVDDGRFPEFCGQIVGMTPSTTAPRVTRVGGRNISMASIVDYVAGWAALDKPLVDQTALKGTFDMSIEFEVPPAPGANDPDVSLGTPIVEAIRDQLGLKLESITAPIQSLVIDHVEELTPN